MQLRNHTNNFDGLRLIAACMVLVYHSYPLLYRDYYHDWLFNLTGCSSSGSICLDVFFIISGYLITQSFIRQPNCIQFFRSRILRIYPALIAALLIGVFIIGVIFTTLSLSQYFSNYYTWRYFGGLSLYKVQFFLPQVFAEAYHHNHAINGSIWSLSYEWTMYVMLFLMGTIGLLQPKKIFLALHLIVIATAIYFDTHPQLTTQIYLGIRTSFIAHLYGLFMGGALLYIYRDKIKINNWIALITLLIWALSFHTNCCAVISNIALPILIVWIAFAPFKLLKLITATGDYSYGIYIFGFPVQQIIIHLFHGLLNIYLFQFLSLAISLGIAILSYHFIEKQALKWKPNLLQNSLK